MNGRITIELGKEKIPLVFGMLAIEEFGHSQSIGPMGWSKMIIDLVYAGYCNGQTYQRKVAELSYEDIAELMEELIINQDPILKDVFKCFEESKGGKNLVEDVKKSRKAKQGRPKV